MKKLLCYPILLSILFLSCSNNTNEETISTKNYNDDFLKYPTIVKVIDEFFDDYQFEENSSIILNQNQFQKKPDGWHVVTQQYNNETPGKWDIIEDELFWDLEEEEFNEIDYSESEGDSEKKKRNI